MHGRDQDVNSRPSRFNARQHVLCGTEQSQRANALKAHDEVDECILEKDGKPCSRDGAAFIFVTVCLGLFFYGLRCLHPAFASWAYIAFLVRCQLSSLSRAMSGSGAYVFRIASDSCRKRAVPGLTFGANSGLQAETLLALYVRLASRDS
jgi:hypothetical protein